VTSAGAALELVLDYWLISKKNIHLLFACMIIMNCTLRAHIIYLVGPLLEHKHLLILFGFILRIMNLTPVYLQYVNVNKQ